MDTDPNTKAFKNVSGKKTLYAYAHPVFPHLGPYYPDPNAL